MMCLYCENEFVFLQYVSINTIHPRQDMTHQSFNLDKKSLSEEDICTKYITPAIEKAGWDRHSMFLQQVFFTDGRIYVKGKMTARGQGKRADYILYYQSNPIAIIEAKDNNHSMIAGMQQGLEYGRILDIPCVFSSNGDGFIFHDRTNTEGVLEKELSLDAFPSPETLWHIYKKYKGITTPEAEKLALQPYYDDGSGRKPRYYQQIAINRTVEAIGQGQNRILLVMATGTGKTYTAFQIAYRLWKAKAKKRILFLADRNALIDQTRRNDFKHFGDKMTVVKNRNVDKAYEIYLALYQGLTSNEVDKDIFRQFSPNFFDLIIIDECHRGSAKEDSSWREILQYFNTATQIGLTATPKETNEVSNSEYFGDPLYTYSLKQGIADGFLAPYRVVRISLDVDTEGWRPPAGFKDKFGKPVEDRIYNRVDFDKKLVIEERRKLVAQKVTEFLKGSGDRFAKTIVFCCDIEHAEGMRSALANENADLVAENYKYIMQITGDNDEGKRELDNFINVEERYPVIATTSELMTTGVDAQTCKVIVLDANINSMTKFKQIIGRGTRIRADYGKTYFTILDFRNATDLFADKDFDGDPIRIKPISENEDPSTILADEEADTTPLTDDETGEDIVIVPPTVRTPTFTSGRVEEPAEKVYVNGINVTALVMRELIFDNDGTLMTKSLKEHTHDIIEKQFKSLDDFLNRWHASDRKQAIIAELEEQGLLVEELNKAVDKDLDLFDMICHLAYDQVPLTRKERAKNVKKRNVFTKYGDQARKILDALLDKYADEGIENIETIDVLKIKPFDTLGSPFEIVHYFGGKENYLRAVKELENEIYRTA
jgi:type I restriction enzyme, R subunit